MTIVTTRQRKKQLTRQKLTSAALSLIARDGVDAVTIDDIANAADVGKGTLYNYFDGKEDILLEFLAELEASVFATISYPSLDSRLLPQVLHDAAWALLSCKADHHSLVRAVMARLAGNDGQFRLRAERFSAAVIDAFAALFVQLRHADMIASHHSPDDLALQFTVLHMGLSMFWVMEGPPFIKSHELTRAQTEIFARGIST
jgi:AcrR family transcriptional regulator